MKTIIITGASRGIGRETAIRLAKEKHTVIAVARNSNDLVSLKDEIESFDGKCLVAAIDITNPEAVNMALDALLKNTDGVDVLINNAGIGAFKPADELEESDWDNVMDVNVKGTYIVSKAVIPYMKKQKSGHIITIASDVSKRTFASGSLYCASKYAQDAFMSGVRKELRPFNVKVSSIYPGLVDTHFHGNQPGKSEHSDWLKSENIADAISYIINTPAGVVIDELMIHPLSQEY